MYSRLINCLMIFTLVLGLWQVGTVGAFYAKAWLAEQLIGRAWQASLKGEARVRPWPWADTWPVAEMQVPGLGIQQIILSGDSGRVLAFGPGHTENSMAPGESGLTLISAHRDTHFSFLKDLKAGDEIILINQNERVSYQVQELAIVDQRDFLIDAGSFYDDQQTGTPSLMLVTCYPFDALQAGGDERFIVFAVGENRVAH